MGLQVMAVCWAAHTAESIWMCAFAQRRFGQGLIFGCLHQSLLPLPGPFGAAQFLKPSWKQHFPKEMTTNQ